MRLNEAVELTKSPAISGTSTSPTSIGAAASSVWETSPRQWPKHAGRSLPARAWVIRGRFASSYLWARATRGNIPFEQLKSCYPCRPDDVMSTVHGVMAEGHWHRFHGRTAESLQMFEQAGETDLEELSA